jgi:hypothetical protein
MAMIARLTIALLAVMFCATCFNEAVNAQVGDDYFFALVVFPDASVSIKNISDHARFVDGYAITSDTEELALEQWMSIYDHFQEDPAYILSLFGADFPKPGIPWGEFDNAGRSALGELLPLPLWQPSRSVPIGKPLGADIESVRALINGGGFQWVINDGAELGEPWPVIFVPEPATIVLFLCGLPVLLILAWRPRRAAF